MSNVPATAHWHHIENSTSVLGCGWGGGKLYVTYHKDGNVTGVYAYTTNDQVMCCRLAMSDSPGQFCHIYVRPLPYARIK